jgi:hypothetical protein
MSEDSEGYIAIEHVPADYLDPSKFKGRNSIKKVVEYFNLWFLLQCQHCTTLFLVEDSMVYKKGKDSFFIAFCPRCCTKNVCKAVRRLKLIVKGIARNYEYDAYTTEVCHLKAKVEVK